MFKLIETTSFKIVELITLFIVLPVSFIFEYSGWTKVILSLLAFVYIVFVLLKVYNNKFKLAPNLNWKLFWKETFVKLAVIIVITTIYVFFVDRDNLFGVLFNKPLLWLIILFVYSITSVYPQELIYRTFFFQRYEALFKSKTTFIAVNAVIFSLAHLLFWNVLVLFLTLVGGVFFALSYYKTRSTLLVSIEHAIYGCWLFTVGMGNMLGFPS